MALPGIAQVQNNLYISKQGNQVGSYYSGSYSKSTDNYENGTMTITATGPITHTIDPAALTIGTNQSKSWTGQVKPNPAAIAGAGLTVDAQLKGNYTIQYSRPKGTENDGTILSTHTCSGCAYHGTGNHGEHEIVQKNGVDSLQFSVISIKLELSGDTLVCDNDTVEYTATVYPSTGGTVTWSTGQTGNKIKIRLKKDTDLTATLAIGGVTYSDTLHVRVQPMPDWDTYKLTVFEGWSKEFAEKAKEIKKITNGVMKNVPAKVTVKGPEASFTASIRDCCKQGVLVDSGQTKGEAVIAGSVEASVPMLSPPWTAQIEIRKQKYGYVFTLSLKYGLFLDMAANLEGRLGYMQDACIPDECMTGGLGLDIPLKLSATASGTVCIASANRPSSQCSGITVAGNRCERLTTNLCGYCSSSNGPNVDKHTSQSWWCWGCPEFEVTPAALSTNLYGSIDYNKNSCNEGMTATAGIGKVVFTASVGVAGYNLDWEYEIWGGAQIYP